MEACSTGIATVYRIIPTIGKHVIAQDALPGRNIAVGVDEAANLRVVITTLQIIEPGILDGGLAETPLLPVHG